MRITFQEVNHNMQFNIMKNYKKLSNLQEMIATGRRLNRPSDDPVEVVNDLGLRSNINKLKQYKRNTEDGLAFMGITGSALHDMNDIMQRVRELAVLSNNDTYTSTQRKFTNEEVSQLFSQMITLINSTYKGEYVFGGTQNKVPPFAIEKGSASRSVSPGSAGVSQGIWNDSVTPSNHDITNVVPGSVVVVSNGATLQEGVDYSIDYIKGQMVPLSGGAFDVSAPSLPVSYTVSYNYVKDADESNTDAIYREVEENVTPRINVSADEVFFDKEHNTGVVHAMVSLGAALVKNDGGGIQSSITNIDDVFKKILSMQAVNGSRVNRFELTRERNEMQTAEITRLQSELEDADMSEVITEFSSLQNAYTASLKAAARVIQPSLVNFLG